jgi:hypothetical protein
LVLPAATLPFQASLCLGHKHIAHNHQFHTCEGPSRLVNTSYKKLYPIRYFKGFSEHERSTSHNDKVRNLQSLPNIIGMIKSLTRRVGGNLALSGKNINAQQIFHGNPEGKSLP